MTSVRLMQAYYWQCEDCGQDNYDRGVLAEFGPGEKEQAFREFHDLGPEEPLPENWDQFQLVTIPDEVECGSCHRRWTTVDDRFVE